MRLFSDSASRVDDPYLERALVLASRGLGHTSPNPAVGCVLVADGVIVGEGYHAKAGEAHAEIVALTDAGEAARGATAYVTLEPCRHHGRTGPCTEALVSAGVSRVVIGMKDPSSDAGGGAEDLRRAGVDVVFAEDSEPFAELNAGWLKRQVSGLPWITVKVGLSLDGRLSLEPGRRSSMTGESGIGVTQALRQRADAVMVGAATVIADDPALTRRSCDGGDESQPVRVILVGEGLPPQQCALLADGTAQTILLAPKGVVDPSQYVPHVSVIEYDAAHGLAGALRALGDAGFNDVLIEPGRRLFTSLAEEGVIDTLVTVTAGGLAGANALELYSGSGMACEDSLAHLFEPTEAGIVGDVVAVSWRPSEVFSTDRAAGARSAAEEGALCSQD